MEEGRKGIANGESSKAKRKCIEHGLEVKALSTGLGHHCLCDASGPRLLSAHIVAPRRSASHLDPEGPAGCKAGPGRDEFFL